MNKTETSKRVEFMRKNPDMTIPQASRHLSITRSQARHAKEIAVRGNTPKQRKGIQNTNSRWYKMSRTERIKEINRHNGKKTRPELCLIYGATKAAMCSFLRKYNLSYSMVSKTESTQTTIRKRARFEYDGINPRIAELLSAKRFGLC